jgi:hypothetical protein
MYVGSLEAISNRETWTDQAEVVDESDVAVDLSAAAIVVAVRDQQSRRVVLTATTGNGKVTLPGANVFQWTFGPEDTRQLGVGTYDVGITVSIDGAVTQLMTGEISVVDGVVP